MSLYRCFFLVICLLHSTTILAEEVIHAFNSEIQINADASLTVTETITVEAENKQINRGIYRDFPTRYKDAYGNNYVVDFNVLEVLRDGKEEPWHTEDKSNGVRVYIGNKYKKLEPGKYTYTLRYYTTRQLGFFEQYDQLYWNVTGNGWSFPVLSAQALVHLPPGVRYEQIQTDAFTGVSGAKNKDFTISEADNNSVLFEATITLPPGEGLSIVVNWPKGYVNEPTEAQKRQWFIQDNKSTIIGFTGLIILWLYFLIAWKKAGKDPDKGVIYPRYQPSKGHSPASIRFVSNMAYDNKTFATALVNMAVKGYIDIDDSKNKKFVIKKLAPTAEAPVLSTGEAIILRDLFSEANKITLQRSNYKIVGKARTNHKKVLKRDYEKKYFRTNMLYSLPGLLISLLTLIMAVYSIDSDADRELSTFLIFWLSFWSIGAIVLLYRAVANWRQVNGALSLLAAVFSTLFAAPFVGAEIFVMYTLWEAAGTGVTLTFIIIILTHFLFYEWMKAPTRLGRKLLDEVEGFKLYLSVTEEQELKYKNSLEKTPELFEQYLPYAIALDVETRWSERFSRVFNRLQQNGHSYSPVWYHGSHWNAANLAGFSSLMGDSLGSAIASSSAAPGSAGGGGGSGGGGGGGGGGGW